MGRIVVLMETINGESTVNLKKSLTIFQKCQKTIRVLTDQKADLNDEMLQVMDKSNALMNKRQNIETFNDLQQVAKLELSAKRELEGLKANSCAKVANMKKMIASWEDINESIVAAIQALQAESNGKIFLFTVTSTSFKVWQFFQFCV